MLFFIAIFSSCGQEKKTVTTTKEEVVKETPKTIENKDLITDLLTSNKNIQTGATGFTVLVNTDKILWFKKETESTDADLDDVVWINLFYLERKQKQLSFKVMDVLVEDVTYNNENYLVAEFDYQYEDDISVIQVGQYSKTEAKVTWKLSVSKNLIKK